MDGWEAGHADAGKKAWAVLPDVFGLKLRVEFVYRELSVKHYGLYVLRTYYVFCCLGVCLVTFLVFRDSVSSSGANSPRHYVVGPARHTFRYPTTMVEGSSFHRLGHHIALKIRSLLASLPLEPSGYSEVVPKIEFWIEYVLREQFTTVDELVEGVSYVAWGPISYCSSVSRFLKEFRDAPNRSEQARSFVDKLCEHILRWFAIVSVENLSPDEYSDLVGNSKKGSSFKGAAWLVGRLIEQGLFSHEVVRRHLVKPLISHRYTDRDDVERSIRTMAIYTLFFTARNPLLQGLLDPVDVQACFKALDTKISPKVGSPDPAKIKVHPHPS